MKRLLRLCISGTLVLSLVLMGTGCKSLPQVSFQASVTSGPAPLNVSFTIDEASSLLESYDNYNWDFGDGASQTAGTAGEPISYEYTRAGNYTVTLTAARGADTAKSSTYNLAITVTHGTVALVKVSPDEVELGVELSQQFQAEVSDVYGNPVTGADITWDASGEVGEITPDGTLTTGTTASTFDSGVVATATLDGHSAQGKATVSILPDVLASVEIPYFEVPAGATWQLETAVEDRYGNQITDADISWTVSNEAAGTITEDGLLTAGIKAGNYNDAVEVVVRQGDSEYQAKSAVVIVPDVLEQVAMAPQKLELGIEQEQQFVAVAADKYGNHISGVEFGWSVEVDAGTITQDGLFTAGNMPGTYKKGVVVEARDIRYGSASTDITIEPDYIAFISNLADEDSEIFNMYIMETDGSNQEMLFENTVKVGQYSFSPDGRRLIFNIVNESLDMCYVNADGNWLFVALAGRNAYEPSWSPDGTKIAFQSWEHDPSEIYVMDVDGGNLVQLTDNAAYDDYPNWSPDGTKIAYNSEVGSTVEIFVMNADGSEQTRLTSTQYMHNYFPIWSPDGTKILFQSSRFGKGTWGLYIMDADGKNVVPISESAYYNSAVASWSPDGTTILFNSDRDEEENGELYLVDTDGSNVTRLTDNSALEYFAHWLPRKKGVAVTEASVIIPNLATTMEEMSAQQLTSLARDSVVKIKTDLGSGSGFIIGTDGLIITNNHVVRDAEEITVYLEDGYDYEGTVLSRDMVHDLALVKINESGLPTLEIANLSGVDLGEQVVVMGYPLDKDNITVTSGLVSSIEYDDGSNITWVQTDSAVNPGNSGGPMLDHYGRVIGVVSAKAIGVAVEGVGYAVSANTVNMFLPEMYPEYAVEE